MNIQRPKTLDSLENWLSCLLDLRFDKKILCFFNKLGEEERLILDILFSFSHRSLDESFEPLVKLRIDQLLQKKSTSAKKSAKTFLELAQLYGWLAYRYHYLYQKTQDDASLLFQEVEAYLEASIKCLLQLKRQFKLGWLFKRKFMNQTEFLIQSIRVEMKEVKFPQKIIEITMTSHSDSKDLEKKMHRLLDESQLNLAWMLCNKILKLQPYSLRLQMMQSLVEQAYHLDLTFQRLLNPSLWQVSNYRYHLFDRADRAIKVFCLQLRHSSRYTNLSLDLFNPLGSIASEYWSKLQVIYEKEYELKTPDEFIYWRLWSQSQILTLGSCLGGAGSIVGESLRIFDDQNYQPLLQNIEVLLPSTLQAQVVKFLATLLVVINRLLKERQELTADLIEFLRIQLEELQTCCLWPNLKKKMAEHVMDLPLLYHRDPRAGPFELLRICACLFSIYPQSSEYEVLDRSLILLEGIYDLWSGSSFHSS